MLNFYLRARKRWPVAFNVNHRILSYCHVAMFPAVPAVPAVPAALLLQKHISLEGCLLVGFHFLDQGYFVRSAIFFSPY